MSRQRKKNEKRSVRERFIFENLLYKNNKYLQERRIQARVKKAEDAENTLKMRLQKQKDRNLTNQGRKKGRRLVVRSKPLNVKEKKIVTVIQEKDTDAEFFTH